LAAVFLAAAFFGADLVAEAEPAPNDSIRITVRGCLCPFLTRDFLRRLKRKIVNFGPFVCLTIEALIAPLSVG